MNNDPQTVPTATQRLLVEKQEEGKTKTKREEESQEWRVEMKNSRCGEESRWIPKEELAENVVIISVKLDTEAVMMKVVSGSDPQLEKLWSELEEVWRVSQGGETGDWRRFRWTCW